MMERDTSNFPTGLSLTQHFQILQKKKKKKSKTNPMLSSFIDNNFIRCQEKQKNADAKQQLDSNFWIEEVKDSASGR